MSMEARHSASFVTFQKPCEEALRDLSTAYNELADKIEAEWEKSARLEARIEEVESISFARETKAAAWQGRAEAAEARCERLEGALRAAIEMGLDHPDALETFHAALRALAEEPYADVPGAGQRGC